MHLRLAFRRRSTNRWQNLPARRPVAAFPVARYPNAPKPGDRMGCPRHPTARITEVERHGDMWHVRFDQVQPPQSRRGYRDLNGVNRLAMRIAVVPCPKCVAEGIDRLHQIVTFTDVTPKKPLYYVFWSAVLHRWRRMRYGNRMPWLQGRFPPPAGR